MPLFIKKGSCDQTNVTEICYIESTFDYDREEYKARIKVYSIKAIITVSRSISSTTLYTGETYTVTSTVKNTGDYGTIINYKDRFPKHIILEECSGCSIINNNVVWEGNLNGDSEHELTYKITPTEKFTQSFSSQVNYFNGIEEIEDYLGKLSLKTEPAISISSKFYRQSEIDNTLEEVSSARLNDENIILKITVENKHPNHDIRIDKFSIYTSDNGEIIPKDTHITRGIRKYLKLPSEGSRISSGSTKTYEFKIIGKRLYNLDIYYDITFRDEDSDEKITNILSEKTSLKLVIKDPIVTSNIENGEEFESGEDYTILVFIQNPNPYIDYTFLNASIETELKDIAGIILDRLNATNRRLVWKIHLNKIVEKRTKYKFNVKINYTTEFGDNLEKEHKMNIYINPPKPLQITKTLPKNILEDDKCEVEVKIKNNRKIDLLRIKVIENIPTVFKVTGISANTISLAAGQETTAYTYTIKAPKVKKDSTYTINTTTSYTYNNEQINETIVNKITVTNIKKHKISFSRVLDDEDNIVYQNEILPLRYTITNNDDVQIKNIRLIFPTQRNFDLVNTRYYDIATLNPGESITIEKVHYIKPKLKDTHKLKRTILSYEVDNEHYEINSSTLNIKVHNSSYVVPSIVIDKELIQEEIFTGEKAEVFLRLENLQNISSYVKVYDELEEYYTKLLPYEKRTIVYNISFDTPGIKTLSPTIAEYKQEDKTFYTSTDILRIKVIKTPTKEQKIIKVSKVYQPETFLEHILNFFKKILTWKRKR